MRAHLILPFAVLLSACVTKADLREKAAGDGSGAFVSWSPTAYAGDRYLLVRTMDDTDVGDVLIGAWVGAGSHSFEYECRMGIKSPPGKPYMGTYSISEQRTGTLITRPGHSYFLDVVPASTRYVRELRPVEVVTFLERSETGLLVKRPEVVYSPATRRVDTGCAAKVWECKGYLYRNEPPVRGQLFCSERKLNFFELATRKMASLD